MRLGGGFSKPRCDLSDRGSLDSAVVRHFPPPDVQVVPGVSNVIPVRPGRRASVRGRWARDEYEQLQPTAPGFVGPTGQLAAAQAAICGVRETELQVCKEPAQ